MLSLFIQFLFVSCDCGVKETWHVFEGFTHYSRLLSAYEALMSMWAHTILFAHQISKPHFMGVISHLWGRFTWMASRPADFHKGNALVYSWRKASHPKAPLQHPASFLCLASSQQHFNNKPGQNTWGKMTTLDEFNRFTTAIDKNSGSRPALNTSSCDCWQRPHLLHSCNLENPCICGLCRTKGPFRDETRRLNMLNI